MEKPHIIIRIPVNKDKLDYKKEFSYLFILKGYFETLERQEARIKEQKNKKTITTQEGNLLFGDIHFYIIMVHSLSNILKRLKKVLSREKEFVDICKKHIKKLEVVKPFRDNLMHIEEGRIEKLLSDGNLPVIITDLIGDNYSFGGETINLNKTFLLINQIQADIKTWISGSIYKQLYEI